MNKTEDIKKQLKNLSDDDGYIGYYEALMQKVVRLRNTIK